MKGFLQRVIAQREREQEEDILRASGTELRPKCPKCNRKMNEPVRGYKPRRVCVVCAKAAK
jgi:hypothetical protein